MMQLARKGPRAWLATCVVAAVIPSAAVAQAPPADVLFVAVDDLNDWVGCLGGHPDAQTPNIDRLAARGVLFTNAHCVSPICGPSRAAVLTGMRPETTGAYTNRGTYADYVPDAVSLPRHLKEHGYLVLGAGKINHGLGVRIPEDWHEYGPGCGVVGTPFQSAELACDGMLPARQVRRGELRCTLPMNGGLSMIDRPGNEWNTFDWGPLDVPPEAFPDVQIARWGAEQLGRPDRPLFVAVGIYKPHQPFFLPRASFERFDPSDVRLPATIADDLADVPAAGRDLALRPWSSAAHATVAAHGAWRDAVAAYLAVITFADEQVGTVVDALAASARADRTWIVLWSDHGWSLGEKEHWGKHDPWSASVRVPLIIVPPAGVELPGFRPGSHCDAPVSLLDLYPTVLDICGLAPRPELEGRSLLPLVVQTDAAWDDTVVATVGRGTHSVFSPGWRYVRYFDGTEELYDLADDPEEWFNVAGDPAHAGVIERLARAIPRDAAIARTVRYGGWKCVFETDGRVQLYDLHAPLGIGEQDDLAAERPDVITAVRAALQRLGVTAERVRLPAPAELESATLVEGGRLVGKPLLGRGVKTVDGELRVGGRGGALLFDRAPGRSDFRLRVTLRSVEPVGRSIALRIGDALLGLHDPDGSPFVDGELLESATLSAASGEAGVNGELVVELVVELIVERAAGRLRVGIGELTLAVVDIAPAVRIDRLGFHAPFADLRIMSAELEAEVVEVARLPRSTLPLLDLADRADLQVIVDRDPNAYLGHPSSVLLADGRTMLMMFLEGHARASLRFVQSDDGGHGWHRRDVPHGWNDVPEGWTTPFQEVPILYRMVDPAGVERVRMFTGTWPIRTADSADGGRSWSALEPLGDGTWGGVVVFADMVRLGDGSYLGTMHDDGRFLRSPSTRRGVPRVYTMRTRDGGASWEAPKVAVEHRIAYLCEAGLVRSPDGRRIAMLMRENGRGLCSYVAFSDDEGGSWSRPRQLPAALTGDRHQEAYAADGRLLISFRDTAPGSDTHGDWVAWVGTFDDIVAGREGEYRVRLGDNHRGADCAYPTLEVLPDGTIFAATYGHWTPGEQPYVIGYHLRLEELDVMFDRGSKAVGR